MKIEKPLPHQGPHYEGAPHLVVVVANFAAFVGIMFFFSM